MKTPKPEVPATGHSESKPRASTSVVPLTGTTMNVGGAVAAPLEGEGVDIGLDVPAGSGTLAIQPDGSFDCESCGRKFHSEPFDQLHDGDPCLESDDCPSFFEEVGITHPDHPIKSKTEVTLAQARADLKALGYQLKTKAGSMFTSGTVIHKESGVAVNGGNVLEAPFYAAHKAFFDYQQSHSIKDGNWRTII